MVFACRRTPRMRRRSYAWLALLVALAGV
ncbi:MAG: hypothetical protein RL112_1315, partial [Planctomycetota bacterium]